MKNKAFALVAVGAIVSASLLFGGSPAVAAACFSSFTNKTTADGLGDDVVNGVYVVGSNVYAATEGGLSISTDGGASFTNKTTEDGLGNIAVYGVYVVGSNVYAATYQGLSISTDGGANFTSVSPWDGPWENNVVWGVYADGSNVYAATNGGLSISADCVSLTSPPPILPETGADPSLVLVGSGMSALLLFGGAAAILASRRKRASD